MEEEAISAGKWKETVQEDMKFSLAKHLMRIWSQPASTLGVGTSTYQISGVHANTGHRQ